MEKDRRLTEHYNKGIAGGKWDGMMLDNHIGYTKWSIPEKNVNPMTLGCKVENDLVSKETREYSIPAYKYKNKVDGKDAKWIFLPDLGRGEGCMGSDNVLAASDITGEGASLEYEIDLASGNIAIGILPTQFIQPVAFVLGCRLTTNRCRLSMHDRECTTSLRNTLLRTLHRQKYTSHCLLTTTCC